MTALCKLFDLVSSCIDVVAITGLAVLAFSLRSQLALSQVETAVVTPPSPTHAPTRPSSACWPIAHSL